MHRAAPTAVPSAAPFLAAATLAAAVLAFVLGAAAAEPLGGEALVRALRAGGHHIYFRHAATDWSQQDRLTARGQWTSCDPAQMRQLAPQGRETARRVGAAIRALGIPVAQVRSSEYCRAADTARLLGLGPVQTTQDIMNLRAAEYFGGHEPLAERLRDVLAEPPPAGSNTVLVGHGNVIRAATGAYPGEAGAAIFAVRGGGYELVAELTPADWQDLARRFGQAE